MLSKELIQQNVPELSEVQISQIVELGNNTLQKEVDDVIKKTRSQVDEVLQKHGFPKAGEKTTEHLDNVLITLKESQLTDDVKTKLQTLESKNKELDDQLKKSNPDFTKKEKDYLDKINLLEGSLNEQKEALSKVQEQSKKDLVKLHLISNMPKVKEGIGEKTKELHVNTAIDNLLKVADFDEQGKLIFRDSEGKIIYNPENKNNPFTAQEMFSKDDYFKEIMDSENHNPGLDLKDKYNRNNNLIPSISGAKTQIEADGLIEKSLLAKGIGKMDGNFATEFDKMRKENNVTQLPLQ